MLKEKAAFWALLLNNESKHLVEDWLVLNLTYHPLLSAFQKVLNGHILLQLSGKGKA